MYRLIVPALLTLTACAPESPASGQMLFADKCVVCHGTTGRGDGPLAAQLDPAAADLTKIAERRGGVWPQLEVMGIVDGYSKRYLPGSDMPIYDEFVSGPLVSFDTGNGLRSRTPAPLLGIVRYLETLQDPAPTRRVP